MQHVGMHSAPPGKVKRAAIPALVIGLLGGQVVFIAVAITLATGDRSFAVVPDYYQKAVDWDDHKAALAESAALGWQAEFQPSDRVDDLGERELVLVLRDRDGHPVQGASVGLSCYHFARAGEPYAIELHEVLPGQYAGSARMARDGFWQFDLAVTRGAERYVAEFKQHVSNAGETTWRP